MMDGGAGRKFKAGKVLHVGDGKRKENATGFMVKSGNVMKDILLGKTNRGPRDPLWEQVERGQGGYRGHIVRRAGLSDMGPAAGSYKTNWQDDVWTEAAGESALESRRGGVKGAFDGDGYRASRFSEHL